MRVLESQDIVTEIQLEQYQQQHKQTQPSSSSSHLNHLLTKYHQIENEIMTNADLITSLVQKTKYGTLQRLFQQFVVVEDPNTTTNNNKNNNNANSNDSKKASSNSNGSGGKNKNERDEEQESNGQPKQATSDHPFAVPEQGFYLLSLFFVFLAFVTFNYELTQSLCRSLSTIERPTKQGRRILGDANASNRLANSLRAVQVCLFFSLCVFWSVLHFFLPVLVLR
jgi:hypothetical protein